MDELNRLLDLVASVPGYTVAVGPLVYIGVELLKPLLGGRSQFYRPLALLIGVLVAHALAITIGDTRWAFVTLLGVLAGGVASGVYWSATRSQGDTLQDGPADTEPPQDAPGSPLTALPVPPASLDGYTIYDAASGRKLRLVAAPLPKKPA